MYHPAVAISSRLMKVTTRLHMKSGIPADYSLFDMHFVAPVGYDQSAYDALALKMHAFFSTTASGATSPVGAWLGNQISTAANHDMNFYLIPPTKQSLGSPVGSSTFTITTVDSSGLPEELAICLSYRADYGGAVEFGPGGTTRPRARLRNRIYLGPLGGVTKAQDTDNKTTFVATDFRVNATAAFAQLKSDAASVDWILKTFSQTDWQDYAPASCWVDNAFDVQRRRGVKASTRTTQSLA